MMDKYRNLTVNFLQLHQRGIKTALLVVLAGGMLFKGLMQLPQINAGKAEIARLNSQIEYEKGRQEEIMKLKTRVNTDEYIEKMASEKLGLVKSNSKIFVDVSSEQ